MSVRIIVDSTADLPQHLKGKLETVPLTIHFGDQEYIDGVTISNKEFYEKLVSDPNLPSTSQAIPSDFEGVFRKVVEAGDTAVVITIASKLSGTYQSAIIAAEDFEGKIFVVDSQNVAITAGILAEYACELVREGKTASQIAEILTQIREKLCLVAVVDTLEYLKRGLQDRGFCRWSAVHQASDRRLRRRDPDAFQGPWQPPGQSAAAEGDRSHRRRGL